MPNIHDRDRIPSPAAVIVVTEWVLRQPWFKPESRPILDRLCGAKVWHQLRKQTPNIARPQLIEQLSSWCLGEVPDEVIKHWSKSHLAKVPDELSNNDLAVRVAFVASFILAVSDVRTMTRDDVTKLQESYRQDAALLRDHAATIREHLGETAYAKDLDSAAELSEFDAEFPPVLDELEPSLIVHRHQKSAGVRGYCVLLAKAMRGLYGKDMRRTVASIATAASTNIVSDADVRYWTANKNA